MEYNSRAPRFNRPKLSAQLDSILETWAPCFTIRENASHLEIPYKRAQWIASAYGMSYKRINKRTKIDRRSID